MYVSSTSQGPTVRISAEESNRLLRSNRFTGTHTLLFRRGSHATSTFQVPHWYPQFEFRLWNPSEICVSTASLAPTLRFSLREPNEFYASSTSLGPTIESPLLNPIEFYVSTASLPPTLRFSEYASSASLGPTVRSPFAESNRILGFSRFAGTHTSLSLREPSEFYVSSTSLRPTIRISTAETNRILRFNRFAGTHTSLFLRGNQANSTFQAPHWWNPSELYVS